MSVFGMWHVCVSIWWVGGRTWVRNKTHDTLIYLDFCSPPSKINLFYFSLDHGCRIFCLWNLRFIYYNHERAWCFCINGQTEKRRNKFYIAFNKLGKIHKYISPTCASIRQKKLVQASNPIFWRFIIKSKLSIGLNFSKGLHISAHEKGRACQQIIMFGWHYFSLTLK